MNAAQAVAAPALVIDARRRTPVPPNGILERRIVANLIEHLKRAGFHLVHVFDGERSTRVTTTKQAMELIFNLDEVSVRFYKTHPAHWHGVLLVLGNGCDIVSDWNFTPGDADGFNAAMEAFDATVFA